MNNNNQNYGKSQNKDKELYNKLLELKIITKDIKFLSGFDRVQHNINYPIPPSENPFDGFPITKYDLDKINETFYFYNDNNEVMLKKDGQYHLIGTPNQLHVYKQVYYHTYRRLPTIIEFGEVDEQAKLMVQRYNQHRIIIRLIAIKGLLKAHINLFYINHIKYNYDLLVLILTFLKEIGVLDTILIFLLLLNLSYPHFCFHADLSIAGNCRMCLVEVDNSMKPVVACAVGIINNISITTTSNILKKSREGILEFLLLNHPLDCPICDQGGECDLQEQSLIYGNDRGRFLKTTDFKRAVPDIDCNSVIKLILTRCIHCTRCVRFITEIGGLFDLSIVKKTKGIKIGFYINSKNFLFELMSNIIDICPVSALTKKNF